MDAFFCHEAKDTITHGNLKKIHEPGNTSPHNGFVGYMYKRN